MELTAWLARIAARRPHLLIAEAPGGTAVRLAVERHAREQGWVVADGPADTDVLVVCGTPNQALARAVEVTWDAIAGPRSRIELVDSQVVEALAAAVERLHDVTAQRADAGARSDPPDGNAAPADMADMDMDMDMALPGGLRMADRASDRDGLRLDVLQLQLGPFLPAWPAGLVLDVVLQGDVVQAATAAGWWDGQALTARSFWEQPGPGRRAAAHLDSAGRLLQLAGWSAAAGTAQELRDRALSQERSDEPAQGPADQPVGEQLARLRRQVEASRTLRWSLRDLGVLTADRARQVGISGPAQRADGDSWDRLRQWFDEAQHALSGAPDGAPDGPRGSRVTGRSPSQALIEALPALVLGLELAGARLVVASLDPDVGDRAVRHG